MTTTMSNARKEFGRVVTTACISSDLRWIPLGLGLWGWFEGSPHPRRLRSAWRHSLCRIGDTPAAALRLNALVRRLVEGLSEEQRRSLLATARRHRYAPGEVVFHEGDPADSLHMIESGRVSVGLTTSYGNQVTFALQSKGEIFGELALLSPDSRRTATVTALERTETMVIHRDDFDRLRADHPQVTEALLRILAARVRMLSERLTEALYVPAEVRVLRRLLEVGETYSLVAEGGAVPLTQDQLGDLAGTARATVNRVLRREAARGVLKLERGRITILDRGALTARAR